METRMQSASQSPAYTVEEVVGNFQALLEHMDFDRELSLLGVGQVHFLLRRRLKAEWQALVIGLWRLALDRSFPDDGQAIFDTLLTRRSTGMKSRQAEMFATRVNSYVDNLRSHGDTDFTLAGEHLLRLIKSSGAAAPALRLRVALHIRTLYTLIFNRLI